VDEREMKTAAYLAAVFVCPRFVGRCTIAIAVVASVLTGLLDL